MAAEVPPAGGTQNKIFTSKSSWLSNCNIALLLRRIKSHYVNGGVSRHSTEVVCIIAFIVRHARWLSVAVRAQSRTLHNAERSSYTVHYFLFYLLFTCF